LGVKELFNLYWEGYVLIKRPKKEIFKRKLKI